MITLHLQKITQFNTECYIGKIDPRKLVLVATKVEMSAVQDAQRPLNEKRVKDIAKYVATENGILPNTLTLATKDNRLTVKAKTDGSGYTMEFPETEAEFEDYKNAIDVMDGQHRLYSFQQSITQLSDNINYEIGFTLYIRPTLIERRSIFISCNEKQEKVSGNLLMWFRSQLNMLTDDEKLYWNIVSQLSNEYPLKGHIIMSAEKIKSGVNAKEVSAALKQAKIRDIAVAGTPLTDAQLVKVICTYLTAWENVIGFKFSQPSKLSGAARKMAGLKYMLLLIPTFWDRAINTKVHFDEQFVENTLKSFITNLGVERSEFFTCEEHKMNFRDRTATDKFANDTIIAIKGLNAGTFNPLGF